MSAAFLFFVGKPIRASILLVIVFMAALVAPPTFAAAARTIDITKFAFNPGELTIAPGTKVVWTNRDEVPHTVTSADKLLVSKALDTSDSFEHTFTDEGDYHYYCTVHPFMIGVVHVRKQ